VQIAKQNKRFCGLSMKRIGQKLEKTRRRARGVAIVRAVFPAPNSIAAARTEPEKINHFSAPRA
jgi:hypothetical protein